MKISVWGLLGPRWNPHNSEIGLYIQKGQTKRAAPCLKIYPNFRGYGRQITYEPWHSGMSRIRHHIPDENWPTCQNQLILFHISYLQLSSLSQFVPIPHGWLWILKILPGSLFHAKFFARPSPPSPSLGFCTAGSCLEYPLHMPNLSDLSLSAEGLPWPPCPLVLPSLTLVFLQNIHYSLHRIICLISCLVWVGLVLSVSP